MIAAVLAAAAISTAAVLAFKGSSPSRSKPAVVLRIAGNELTAEVVADEAARRRGLAGRRTLAEDHGMLFVFPDRAERSFWMRGMRFPIDIIWIARGRVTRISRDLPVPDRGLPLYSSGTPADRALEVAAGWARSNGVEPWARVSVVR